MRIMYVHPSRYPPDVYAGTELAMHGLCRALVASGHEVWAAALSDTVPEEDVHGDHVCGYPVVRSRGLDIAVRSALAQFRPDVFVTSHAGVWMVPFTPIFGDTPVVVCEHEVSRSPEGAPASVMARGRFVANSETTAAHLGQRFALASTVVRPLFGVDQYAGIQPHGDKALFVSLQPRKGADVAIAIARARPNARFVFVESWTRDAEATRRMRAEVAELPNVALLTNQRGLARILPEIKLLLMPSRGQESWGRTVTEAQLCGIPVLGSSRGNLIRTIGPGGVTLDPDEPTERWLAAFDTIMDDPARHQDLSAKARAHAAVLAREIGKEFETFEAVLAAAVAERAA